MSERVGSGSDVRSGAGADADADSRPLPRIRRLRSVRARITLVTTIVVAVSAGLGGAAFAFVLSQSLLAQATTSAEAELDRFEGVLDVGGPAALAELDGYAQVVRDGVVVGASDDLEDAPALVGGIGRGLLRCGRRSGLAARLRRPLRRRRLGPRSRGAGRGRAPRGRHDLHR